MTKLPGKMHLLHFFVSLLAAFSVMYIAMYGIGSLPPLGSALNPGSGIWTSASSARPISQEVLHFQGLSQPVTVIFEANGTPHISAANDDDLLWSIGYLQARFRLTQMDLLRRQGEGRLSEVLGPDTLDTDRFQVTLGLDRIAVTTWQTVSRDKVMRQNLLSFSAGVNARITEAERDNTLPFMFKLLNYQPAPWTPLDTLVIQGDITQDLTFSTTPLHYALLVKSLGYQRTMQWFPVLPPDSQHPYDPAPSASLNTFPLWSQTHMGQASGQHIADLDAFLQHQLAVLIHTGSASNNWAVNGPRAAHGKALMAGDPHLDLSLPAIWYQMEARSPNYAFAGITVPGLPLIIMGHNQHISWSITDVQNTSTMYYAEKTDAAHPSQYYWQGAWHAMQHLVYHIPVKNQHTALQDVYLTVHGPILPPQLSSTDQTTSIDWMGAHPSNNLKSITDILHATNYMQFRAALSTWVAPTLNFVYADDQGDIAMIAPGYFPIVRSGVPWLPLPGTGEADVIGSIPYDAVPQIYNPPDHMVFSANQRPVSNDYPYYIGTTWDGFDNGYRADEIYVELNSKPQLTIEDMERIQNSNRDYLATLILPELLKTLHQASLSSNEQRGLHLLEAWNENMDTNSSAASIWWTFWDRYLSNTFQPWWEAYHVPTQGHPSLIISADQAPLDECLEAWTLYDQSNPAFTPPQGPMHNAHQVMLQAFKDTIHLLEKTLGNDPQQWAWSKLHTRTIASSLQAKALDYGPVASPGDDWTLNSASTLPKSMNSPLLQTSIHGPSWRIIVDWGTNQSESVYPGGQDENPASPWYDNQISLWWNGQYYPMIDGATARKQPDSVIWLFSS